MAPQTSTRLTYEDLLDLPDDGKQYELIEGELVVNPPPIPRHQLILLNIATELRIYCRESRAGQTLPAPTDVILAPDVVVQPDVLFIRAEHLHIIRQKNVQGAPTLVVEVLSDSTRRRDEGIKRQLYERHGVDEYWIVDPVIDTIKIYRRTNDAFVRVTELSNESGGVITSPLLPAFALDVSVVFDV